MPFHIANLALSPRAVVQKANSQEDPYHDDHQLIGDSLLYKLSGQKNSLWNSIISILQTRAHEFDEGVDDTPWCLLFVKDRMSLAETLGEANPGSSCHPNQMSDLQKRIWLSRIRICYTPTSHHLRAIISALHIRSGPNKDANGILPSLDSEYPDRAPSLIAVYNLVDIIDDEQDDNSTREDIAGKEMTRHDELMHIMAAMSELQEYFNSTMKRSSHLIYYDSKQHHIYHSHVEGQSVFPVATEIPPEVQMINTIFHSWTDWIIEAEVVLFDRGDEVEGLEKSCISLVAVPSRRITAAEDLHWTFQM
ncbi:hypothetical protein K450DRAFT_225038 [Umbelopsis ramanniana AG]|uniref:Uncharacterized protein n=1 Tax=Umbelopsis ramanniana AG TaxID=1314678 RepID=A0AAD5EH52_UMBRA|nr:uncharacterized protein K450DRAFT_225038 [Umbelopsis ramanniana AG]KAI8582836.1 hypothetical protein K450DRAFT_225038 [Umbelopsis ramanniana AG]